MDQGAAQELAHAIEAALGPLTEDHRAALLAVDRERFVRDVDRTFAWQNLALPLDTSSAPPARPVPDLVREHGSWLGAALQPEFAASGSTISQPLMYMLAFRILELARGLRFLELGTGTGYGAALAAHVVARNGGHVTSVDVDSGLIAAARARAAADGGITFLHADGLQRPDLVAQHDRCWVTFSITDMPGALLDALPEGGRMLAPIGSAPPSPQRYVLYTRHEGSVEEQEVATPVFFIPARALQTN
jgi:protein-L-isoaspartate(D-aspartate) O-methyltransferase